MKRIIKLTLLLILLAALAFPTAVYAAGVSPSNPADKVVLGGTYNLASGDSLDGNLAVMGGTVTIAQGATVNGDVFQAGGTLTVDGKINGNLSTLGGTVFLNSHAEITGDVSTVGGTLHRDSGAKIGGEVVNGTQGPLTLTTPQTIVRPANINFKPVTDVLWWMFSSFMLAMLGLLIGLFMPSHLDRTGQAAIHQPVMTGGMGLLTGIIAPILLVLLTITIILIPISLIGIFVLMVAWLFGWVAIGTEIGHRMMDLFKANWPVSISAALGTFVLSLVAFGIGRFPCVGWIVPVMIGFIGIGAVLLTRFGSIPYPPVGGPVPPAGPVYSYPSSAAPQAPQTPQSSSPYPGENYPPSNPPDL